MDTTNLVQDTLSDSRSIFERIRLELLQAKQEILVAMAWFTDDDLFAILEDRLRQNVKISLIISEQVDNEKLDFNALRRKGAEVIKVKNVGWGMMNQKFCVIDRKIAITGSYNWTINAKNNNHETVVVTNFPKTVEELVHTFLGIKDRAERLLNGETLEDISTPDHEALLATKETTSIVMQTPIRQTTTSFYEQSLKAYSDVLDHIIASEVGSFDKELLKASGFNWAMENNGDHQILPQAMDSLYSNFINEIEVVEEKKNRLLAQIEEQRKISVASVELKTANEISNLKENGLLEAAHADEEILQLSAEIADRQHELQSNRETKIPFFNDKIALLQDKIKTLQLAFVMPPVNWPATAVLGFMTLLLVLYIFVFYSSVAYIFIFSKEDIKTMLLSGAPIIEAPEVFNPHAISKIWDKGSGGILFLFLFVAIPLALGMYKVFFKGTAQNVDRKEDEKQNTTIGQFFIRNLGIILIIVVDIFIAYKVAVNINAIELITGDTDKEMDILDLLGNSNFWLVFALGALGVYLFSVFFEKFFILLDSRTTTHHQEKVKYEVSTFEKAIEEHLHTINELKLLCDATESAIVKLTESKEERIRQRQQAPINRNDKINGFQQQLLSYKERIGNIGSMYRSQIENDKLPISKAELENRVNIYMEGWSKFLYQDYAILRAETKTREAIHACESWLSQRSVAADLQGSISENLISLQN
ncbi:phospholipase D-like domain-containing protein [Sphingobacterium bambusae]|uniref:phospholipase D n=1 Tax=Sphingobacterium bambusae TaxID=662858 RepID=A0ABW6BPR0_9SPHI|nr:phospholipase D-like domain-containing protein [Sphingobacterium bambusae]WPL47874.1 phospholipase D-like domain-containing protein [Sphingobacterium bambusae]